MDKYLINRIKQLEVREQLRRDAWISPDPLSTALREVCKDDLLALAAELDSLGSVANG